MDSSVSPKDQIWFLRMCHHISNSVYHHFNIQQFYVLPTHCIYVFFMDLRTNDQQLENHSMKYHRQQPLYNTLELLMMDIVVPKTC